MRLVLASGSSRRAELLDNLGLDFDVDPADIDESRHPGEDPASYVERLARQKAEMVAGPDRLVVAADTTVVHEGHVMGKPAHPEEARAMLRRLQGAVHEVFTGLAVAVDSNVESLVDVTTVTMLTMTDGEIDDYVAGGEPMDKAGAYALQGQGGVYVSSLGGSPFTVIGLPIHLLPRLIARMGVRLEQFRRLSDS